MKIAQLVSCVGWVTTLSIGAFSDEQISIDTEGRIPEPHPPNVDPYVNVVLSGGHSQFPGCPNIRRQHNKLVCDPAFVIVGAQKAGTTSLSHWTSKHPGLRVPHNELANLFEKHSLLKMSRSDVTKIVAKDRRVSKILPSYSSSRDAQVLLGVKRPALLSTPWAIRNLHRVWPWSRIIVTFRQPVDRAYSGFHHSVSQSKKSLSKLCKGEDFEKCFDRYVREEVSEITNAIEESKVPWNASLHSCPSRELYREVYQRLGKKIPRSKTIDNLDFHPVLKSLYDLQLCNVFHYFPGRQVLTVWFEEIKSDPAKVMRAIASHLGIPPTINNESLRNITKESHGSQRGDYRPRMLPSTRSFLANFFRPHIERLASLTGPPPSSWY